MVGCRNYLTLGATICSALCAAGAAWLCWEEAPGLAGFFAALVVASVMFWTGRRWVLSLLVAGNLAFCTVGCMFLVSAVRSRQVDFWPPLAAVVLAPGLAAIACYLWGTAAEAERLIGRRPDQVTQTTGVLLHGVTLLAATNSRAAAYGAPQSYELRVWQRGDFAACVVIDRNGLVAGRYSRRGP